MRYSIVYPFFALTKIFTVYIAGNRVNKFVWELDQIFRYFIIVLTYQQVNVFPRWPSIRASQSVFAQHRGFDNLRKIPLFESTWKEVLRRLPQRIKNLRDSPYTESTLYSRVDSKSTGARLILVFALSHSFIPHRFSAQIRETKQSQGKVKSNQKQQIS